MEFALGTPVATSGAVQTMAEHNFSPQVLLALHLSGEWGDIDPEDWAANDQAVMEGSRIVSAYGTGDARLYVITEADRSVTTILRPDEY